MQFRRDYSRSYLLQKGGSRWRNRFRRWWWLLGMFSLGAALILMAALWPGSDGLGEGWLAAVLGPLPTPTPYASDLAKRALQAWGRGDRAAAIADMERAVLQQPQQVSYRYELGRFYLEQEDWDAVAQEAQAISALDREDPLGHTLQVDRLTRLGQTAEAIAIGLAALREEEPFAPLLAALAHAHLEAGRLAEGQQFAELALVADSLSVDAQRAQAFALLYSQDREGAILHLREAARLAPNSAAILLELAGVLLADDQNQEAIDTYELLLARHPQHPRANLRLCQAYAKLGQFAQALGYCQDATALAPADGVAWLQLGVLLYNQRDFAGAVEALTACASSDNAALTCWWMRALAHYYLGDCRAAWPIWEVARERARAVNDELVLSYLAQGEELMRADAECLAARFLLGD